MKIININVFLFTVMDLTSLSAMHTTFREGTNYEDTSYLTRDWRWHEKGKRSLVAITRPLYS